MSGIKDVLPILCKYVNSLTGVSLVPEHLRLAKYDAPDKNGAEVLWKTLHVLSYYAAKEERSDIDFRNYDPSLAVKLYLAFLKYSAIEFYGLSQNNNQNRILLIALAWLLGTKDVLAVLLRAKLADSPLGAEYSNVDLSELASSDMRINSQPLSTDAQFNSILHLNGKVNLNLMQISESISEWGRLVSKIHAASIDYFGYQPVAMENPLHLSVSELALTKRIATLEESSLKDRQQLQKLRDVTALLNAHTKWLDKRHVFFDWMATVIQEHRKSVESNVNAINSRELASFTSLLRHLIADKHRALKEYKDTLTDESPDFSLNCPSRLLRSQCSNNEAQKWSADLNERQLVEEESLQRNRKRLATELKEMLQLIPLSIRV